MGAPMNTDRGELPAGTLIGGRYRILRLIGQGGQSRVYLATDERTGRERAVKELRRDIPDRALVRESFLREIGFLRDLHHPCLPEISDVIDGADESLYIVMRYIEGRTLSAILQESGALSERQTVRLGIELCDVLTCLHTQLPPIIYRDLKPGNIMLRPDGSISLIDLGSARRFRMSRAAGAAGEREAPADDTVPLGTRGYAAPEQFGGRGQTDVRTDIYCLGATLYHLVTGCNPAKPPVGVRPIRTLKPALSESLEAIIEKCTHPDPSERYASCVALRHALSQYRKRDALRRAGSLCLGIAAAACAVLIIAAGIPRLTLIPESRAQTAAAAADKVPSGSEEARRFYRDMENRIRENRPALLAAGMEEEELDEILTAISAYLEDDLPADTREEKRP